MSRIAATFDKLARSGNKALIPYITAGDPDPEITVPLMHAMVEAGADLIELGVPFSDPMADGPVIQKAHQRALLHGTSLRDVFAMVKAFRRQDNSTPVLLMGYLNPLEAMGYETAADEASAAGVDGMLIVDLPPEEGAEFNQQLQAKGIDPVYLLAPTTTASRMDTVASAARGFVYYVSIRGVTGAGGLDYDEVAQRITEIRQHTGLPVGVGFGINSPESAVAIGRNADAVIIGSAIVTMMADASLAADDIISNIVEFLRGVRQALDDNKSASA